MKRILVLCTTVEEFFACMEVLQSRGYKWQGGKELETEPPKDGYLPHPYNNYPARFCVDVHYYRTCNKKALFYSSREYFELYHPNIRTLNIQEFLQTANTILYPA